MSGSVTLSISLFGAFRPFSDGADIIVEVPHGATLSQVRQALTETLKHKNPGFNQEALITISALADEKEVLREHATFTRDAALAILPPVCGG